MANRGPSFGLSRELEQKNQAKFSIEEALEVLQWIEAVIGAPFEPPLSAVRTSDQVSELLKDGTKLCLLMNRLQVPLNYHKKPGMPFIKMENISLFLEACKSYGVSDISCFQTVDLYENKQPYKVVECLRSLVAVAQSKQIRGQCPENIQFPNWVVRLSAQAPRNFSRDVIRQGEAVIPLQYGTNKCASQKGMTPYGLARQIKQPELVVKNGANGHTNGNGHNGGTIGGGMNGSSIVGNGRHH